jgi:hypothetical protein
MGCNMEKSKKQKLEFANPEYNIWLRNFYEHFGILHDRHYCSLFGLPTSTVSQYKRNNSFPYSIVLEHCLKNNVSLDSIFSTTPLKRQGKVKVSAPVEQIEFEIPTINKTIDIQLPELHQNQNKSLKFFYQNKNVFVIDTGIQKISKDGYYLLSKNELFLIVYITIKFDDAFAISLIDSKTLKIQDSQTVSSEKLLEYEVLGLVTEVTHLEKILS